MRIRTFLDLGKTNEVRNARFHNLAADPSNPTEGLHYWHTADKDLYIWDGAAWVSARNGGDAATLDGDPPSFYLDRGNHTGTQTASTISDFNTAVRTSRLDQMAAPTAPVGMNGQRLTGLADPTDAQDAATKAYADALSAGRDFKDSVRAATAAALPAHTRAGNVLTASANGAFPQVDGVTIAVGERILVKDEGGGTSLENGLYVLNDAGSAGTPWVLARAADADASAEVTPGLTVSSEEGGTNADQRWILTTNGPIVLNTTALTFTRDAGETITAGGGLTRTGSTLDVGAGNGIVVSADSIAVDPAVVGRKATALIGNGAATSIQVTHGLANRWVTAQVFDAATGEMVWCDVTLDDANNATFTFSTAPAADEFRVVIVG